MARSKRPDPIAAATAQTRDEEKKVLDALTAAAQDSGMRTRDSFQNFLLNLGIGTDNAAFGGSTYGFNPITRVRSLLEWIHRGSWLGGVAVDLVADDMTRAGTEVTGGLDDNDAETIHTEFMDLEVWTKLNAAIKWSRLYGGCLAVILIDKQDLSTELRLDTIGKDSFKGLHVLDRWMVEPSLFGNGIISDYGPNLGMPKWYKITSFAPVLMGKRVHYTRCIRLEGISLPYWQAVSENMWGISVLERLYDRMIAFDSATTGAAQLVHKSALRTFKVQKLREIATTGGVQYQGLLKYIDMMRRFQGIEQVTLIDAEDEFEIEQRSGFAGIPEALMQFGQQLAGALQIPLVRLFGMSPAGFSATGDSDMHTYYDNIKHRQKKDLYGGMNVLYRVTAASKGIQIDDDFAFDFVPLWQMTDIEKSTVAANVTGAVLQAEEQVVVSKAQALRELKQSSRRTGIWATIQEEDITQAEQEPPPMLGGELGGPPEMTTQKPGASEETITASANQGVPRSARPNGQVSPQAQAGGERPTRTAPPAGKDPEAEDAALGSSAAPPRRLHLHLVRDSDRLIDFQGLPIYVETKKGEIRKGRDWSVKMPADYGFVRLTGSAEGPAEGLDAFVGDDRDSTHAFIIEQQHPQSGMFDEHKVMLGFKSAARALDCYESAFSDGSGGDRIGGVKKIAVKDLPEWIEQQGFAPAA